MSVVKKILRESPTEYFLQVPYAEKDRAKRIEGYTWNGVQKCWVFPKSERAHNSIVSEFGDELEDLTIRKVPSHQSPQNDLPSHSNIQLGSPSANLGRSTAPAQVSRLPSTVSQDGLSELATIGVELRWQKRENLRLENELEKLRQDNTRLIAENASKPSEQDASALIQTVSDSNRRASELEQRLTQYKSKMKELLTERNEMIDEIEEGERENTKLSSLLSDARIENERVLRLLSDAEPTSQTHEFLVSLAIRASEGDASFAKMVKGQHISEGLAILISSELEKKLTRLLKQPVRTVDLFQILRQAEDEQVLSSDLFDLAHLIRRQRNFVAHNSGGRTIMIGRVLLVLFAAALLWPHLPKQ